MTNNICLIVDDSKIVRKVTRKIFESLKYDIEEAEDGAQALEYCRKMIPKLIMLDWHMPVMNGLEFLKELRAMPEGNKPVVIFCTTETEFNRIQEAILSGANEYVMKPFDEEIIKGKLAQLGLF
jgi:two-component system chemotaxis response regulator CheY